MQGVIEKKEIINEYRGVQYQIRLVEPSIGKERKWDEVDPQSWWVVEYTDETETLAKRVGFSFLWWDSFKVQDAPLYEKYRLCELKAIDMINWFHEKYRTEMLKHLLHEIGLLAWVHWQFIKRRFKRDS